MLEKIMSKRKVNHLSWLHRNDVINTKKHWIITRQGTNIGDDKAKSTSKILQNHDYPNPKIQRKICNDATHVFKYLDTQKDTLDLQSTRFNELLQLLSKESAS